MFRDFLFLCKCGHGDNITEFGIEDELWCCKTTNETCRSDDKSLTVTSIGTVQSLTEECHSKTYKSRNYYPTDEYRNGIRQVNGRDRLVPRSHLNIHRDNRYKANIYRVQSIQRS